MNCPRAPALSHARAAPFINFMDHAAPENSVTKSRTDCALTHQMVGGIETISPCVKSTSEKLFLDLLTMSAPSGEDIRTGRARWTVLPPP